MSKNRERQRLNRRNKREEKLLAKNEYGVLDKTPKQAIDRIRNRDHSI